MAKQSPAKQPTWGNKFMTLNEFNKIAWRPGMRVAYKFRSIDSKTGESIRETEVAKVEFDEGNGWAGILGPLKNGSRACVPYSQILEVSKPTRH